MPNITISLDEDLIKSGRRYAEAHKTSLNGIIRMLLEQTINIKSNQWLEECFQLMDHSESDSKGQSWKREDLYDNYTGDDQKRNRLRHHKPNILLGFIDHRCRGNRPL